MPSSYPGTLDSFTNPTGTDTQAAVDHAAQHASINDAMEAVQGALGVNPQGAEADVAARLTAIEASIPSGGAVLQTDVFTVSGSPHTWTKAAGAKWLKVLLIGGGGGGGGGGLGGASRLDLAGGGGGGGNIVEIELPADALGATETVTVGAGGTGGASATNGTVGGNTTIGSKVFCGGGADGRRGAQAAGTTGYYSYRGNDYVINNLAVMGATVGSSNADMSMPSGGGGGGNASPQAGALGGGHRSGNLTPLGVMDQLFPGWPSTSTRGSAGAAGSGVAGTAGGHGGTSEGLIGNGGGGGGGTDGHFVGAAGGDGGLYGGGGGGGGGKLDNGLLSAGAGGAGGAGVAIIIQLG